MGILDFLLPQNMPGGSAYEKKQREAAAAQAASQFPDMDEKIAEDPTAVLASEEDIEASAHTPEKKEPDGPGLGEMSLDWAIGSFEREEGAFDPPALNGLYHGAMKRAKDACELSSESTVDIPELTGDYPLWYQAVSLFIRRFPWRLAFAVVVLWFGLPWVMEGASGDNMGEMLSYGFGAIGKFLVILILLVVNSIWGIITNIIRYVLKWASDWLLERQIDSIAKASLKRQKEEAARPSTTTDMSVVE